MDNHPKRLNTVLLTYVLLGAGFLGGCASQNSLKAPLLSVTNGKNADLSAYQTATFVTFELAPKNGKPIDNTVAVDFTNQISDRVEHDFVSLFHEVRRGKPLGRSDELVITGKITEYNPGDRGARMMLIGLGAAGFKGQLVMKDGATGDLLSEAKIDKVWAWGGIMGASKGIEEMVPEAAASAARTIATLKGWKP